MHQQHGPLDEIINHSSVGIIIARNVSLLCCEVGQRGKAVILTCCSETTRATIPLTEYMKYPGINEICGHLVEVSGKFLC